MDEARSAYEDYPGYRVELLPQTVRARVRQGATLLADSRRTLLVKETAHRDVTYFPEADVWLELFEPSDHRSFCPFKGAAEYLSLARAEHPAPREARTPAGASAMPARRCSPRAAACSRPSRWRACCAGSTRWRGGWDRARAL
jgi:uncharacterized protein (DUF427 family)